MDQDEDHNDDDNEADEEEDGLEEDAGDSTPQLKKRKPEDASAGSATAGRPVQPRLTPEKRAAMAAARQARKDKNQASKAAAGNPGQPAAAPQKTHMGIVLPEPAQ